MSMCLFIVAVYVLTTRITRVVIGALFRKIVAIVAVLIALMLARASRPAILGAAGSDTITGNPVRTATQR